MGLLVELKCISAEPPKCLFVRWYLLDCDKNNQTNNVIYIVHE